MPANSFATVVLTPFQLSTTENWTVSKLNQLGNPTVSVAFSLQSATNVSGTAPTATGQILYYDANTGYWTPSPAPIPADGTVYLGGDGQFHNIGAITSPSIVLFNHLHYS